MRFPLKVEAIHSDWVGAGRTGVVELHYQEGELRRVYIRATVELSGDGERRATPAPIAQRL